MKFSRLGMLVPVLALGLGVGACSKSDTPTNSSSSSAKDVAGLSKETLLVLKFHHDS